MMKAGIRLFVQLPAAAVLFLTALFWSDAPAQAGRFITVASTTSTQNSGLFDYLLPLFSRKTGIDVHVVAVGTGAAIRLAREGNADVLLVHHKPSEEKFVRDGFGVKRYDLMYNDFVLVGPAGDPAGIAGAASAADALKRIAEAKAPFVSRGDDSGTHKKERALWQQAGIDADGRKNPWYRETGSGMGATLNVASAMNAYALSDRATWISFANKGDLKLLFAGDPALFNQYGVILVNPAKFPHVKARDGQRFIDWLISDEGQKAIAAFRVRGQQLFVPNAKP